MNTRKNSFSSFLTAALALAFVFALGLSQSAAAQGRLDVRAAGVETEVKGLAQFAEQLAQFVGQSEQLQKRGSATEADLTKLQELGRRVKDGSSNLRRFLQALISKLKASNRWNDQFDAEFVASISNSAVKSFIQRNGGARKLLSADINPAIDSIGADADAIVDEVRNHRAAISSDAVFIKAAFSSPAGLGKGFKCGLLAVGIAAAELAGAKLTAGNLDAVFDRKCGGGAGAATQ